MVRNMNQRLKISTAKIPSWESFIACRIRIQIYRHNKNTWNMLIIFPSWCILLSLAICLVWAVSAIISFSSTNSSLFILTICYVTIYSSWTNRLLAANDFGAVQVRIYPSLSFPWTVLSPHHSIWTCRSMLPISILLLVYITKLLRRTPYQDSSAHR